MDWLRSFDAPSTNVFVDLKEWIQKHNTLQKHNITRPIQKHSYQYYSYQEPFDIITTRIKHLQNI
jgi:hypothetical protein